MYFCPYHVKYSPERNNFLNESYSPVHEVRVLYFRYYFHGSHQLKKSASSGYWGLLPRG